jgi:hypothetical protein
MNSILLGHDAQNKPVYLDRKLRQSTHMHVIGGSGTGKSKFLEWVISRDIRDRQGLCILDWHGTLFKDVLRCCAYHGVGIGKDARQVVLLNPSEPEFITGFNPFVGGTGDVSVQVSRRWMRPFALGALRTRISLPRSAASVGCSNPRFNARLGQACRLARGEGAL